jgi:hypothetical protein
MIEVLKQALEAFEAIPEEIEGWIPDKCTDAVIAIKQAIAELESQERNFCPRCGKRTADLTVIHTCTPPMEKNNEA